jgi:hypothetical protein
MVFTPEKDKIVVFQAKILFSMMGTCPCFGGTCCLHPHCKVTFTLKMGPEYSFETTATHTSQHGAITKKIKS